MPGSNAHIEKRQFERVATRMQVRYELIPEGEADALAASAAYQDLSVPVRSATSGVKDVMTVVAENISVGGLMIVGDSHFNGGQTLRMEISLPQTPHPLKALAVIVRASDTPQNGRYTAGVRFLAINKQDVALIERYVAGQKAAGKLA